MDNVTDCIVTDGHIWVPQPGGGYSCKFCGHVASWGTGSMSPGFTRNLMEENRTLSNQLSHLRDAYEYMSKENTHLREMLLSLTALKEDAERWLGAEDE